MALCDRYLLQTNWHYVTVGDMDDQRSQTCIKEVIPSTGTLIETIFDAADYRDAFVVPASSVPFTSVAAYATAYFVNQPRWLSLVSMNLATQARLHRAIDDATFAEGDSVGSWKVHGRSSDEIVFGDDMGFMEYRFSFWLRPDGAIEASTAVRYKWRRVGRYYFAIVKPMHKRFVPISLRATLGESTSVLVTR